MGSSICCELSTDACRDRRSGFDIHTKTDSVAADQEDDMNTRLTAGLADHVTGGSEMARQRDGAGDGVRRATGRSREEWFSVLDAWGAAGRPYRVIADWLTGERGLSRWWAQKLIVEYEQARGLRPPGVRPNGTFQVSASKTIEAPTERVFAHFVDPALRERWLPGVTMRERGSQPGRSARFDWDDGSRLVVAVETSGSAKSQVAVQHERLPTAASAEQMKSYWRQRLTALKTVLEAAVRES
jgi:hypothetical protein